MVFHFVYPVSFCVVMVETDPTKLLDNIVPVHKRGKTARNEFIPRGHLSAIDATQRTIVY